MRIHSFGLALLVLVLVGCAAAPPTHAERATLEREVVDVPASEVHAGAWRSVGHVVGESCRMATWNATPTEYAARHDARVNARRIGASGVVAMRCRVTDPINGPCEGWRCDAEAVAR